MSLLIAFQNLLFSPFIPLVSFYTPIFQGVYKETSGMKWVKRNEVLSPPPQYLIIRKDVLMYFVKEVYTEEYS